MTVKAYEDEKLTLVEEQRSIADVLAIKESDIERIIETMRTVDAEWVSADLENRTRFQKLIFPEGLVFDYKNIRFGTRRISPLYRSILLKEGSEEPSNDDLVAGVGFEPTTLWL